MASDSGAKSEAFNRFRGITAFILYDDATTGYCECVNIAIGKQVLSTILLIYNQLWSQSRHYTNNNNLVIGI